MWRQADVTLSTVESGGRRAVWSAAIGANSVTHRRVVLELTMLALLARGRERRSRTSGARGYSALSAS